MAESNCAHRLHAASCMFTILSRHRDFNPENVDLIVLCRHTVSSEHERRRETSTISNATCGRHRNIGARAANASITEGTNGIVTCACVSLVIIVSGTPAKFLDSW